MPVERKIYRAGPVSCITCTWSLPVVNRPGEVLTTPFYSRNLLQLYLRRPSVIVQQRQGAGGAFIFTFWAEESVEPTQCGRPIARA